jgi:hypothetical protein
MTYSPDLAEGGPVKSVGYLTRDREYPQGEVADLVFDRLVRLAKLRIVQWFGHHHCDLDPCGPGQPQPELYYEGLVIPRQCSTDIFVPDQEAVYVAPALILHYIRFHRYLPPTCFLEAVLRCPQPGSDEYFAALKRAAPDFPLFCARPQCSSET